MEERMAENITRTEDHPERENMSTGMEVGEQGIGGCSYQ